MILESLQTSTENIMNSYYNFAYIFIKITSVTKKKIKIFYFSNDTEQAQLQWNYENHIIYNLKLTKNNFT